MVKGSREVIGRSATLATSRATTFGNTAIAGGAWQGKGTDGNGKAIDAHERWVDTWMKMPDGKWQCIATASAPAKM
jgi:ketosteroid isomerase-like protein